VAAGEDSSSNNNFKCITDYQMNMGLQSTVSGNCNATACAAACAATTSCSASVHTAMVPDCQCQLGHNVLFGSDLNIGPRIGSQITTCNTLDDDWLRFGAVADPSPTKAVLK
jgi:hypothetical protein